MKKDKAPMMVNIKTYLKMRIRLLFLKQKIFYGRYLENEIALRKFKEEEDVIIIKKLYDKAPLTKFDYRLRGTEANKIKKLTILYVNDSPLTRMLGWKPTIDHEILS